MMEAVRTSETSVDNHSTRQYNPEDSSEQMLCFSVGCSQRHILTYSYNSKLRSFGKEKQLAYVIAVLSLCPI
jgi:hypothetical protein